MTRLSSEELVIVAPDIENIRQQVSDCIDQFSCPTLPLHDWQYAANSERRCDKVEEEGAIADEAETRWKLEAGVVEKRQLLNSWQQLQSDLCDLNGIVKTFSHHVSVISFLFK